jgi:hypothetical protein
MNKKPTLDTGVGFLLSFCLTPTSLILEASTETFPPLLTFSQCLLRFEVPANVYNSLTNQIDQKLIVSEKSLIPIKYME